MALRNDAGNEELNTIPYALELMKFVTNPDHLVNTKFKLVYNGGIVTTKVKEGATKCKAAINSINEYIDNIKVTEV